VSEWYAKKGIPIDPVREASALIGSKEGIAHLPLAFINRGDKVLVPDPAYPVYRIATILADGQPISMPLTADNGFLPDIDKAVTDAKLLFINYPNNPTAAVADSDFFRAIVDYASDNDIIVCHDAAYLELTLRRLRSSVVSLRTWGNGRWNRNRQPLQNVQYDRLANRVCSRKRRRDSRPQKGQIEPRLRRIPGGTGSGDRCYDGATGHG